MRSTPNQPIQTHPPRLVLITYLSVFHTLPPVPLLWPCPRHHWSPAARAHSHHPSAHPLTLVATWAQVLHRCACTQSIVQMCMSSGQRIKSSAFLTVLSAAALPAPLKPLLHRPLIKCHLETCSSCAGQPIITIVKMAVWTHSETNLDLQSELDLDWHCLRERDFSVIFVNLHFSLVRLVPSSTDSTKVEGVWSHMGLLWEGAPCAEGLMQGRDLP